MKKYVSLRNKFYGFSLPELLVAMVIIGILVLVALPNLMPLISRAKATEAQQQLTFLHSLEQSYFYTYEESLIIDQYPGIPETTHIFL